MTTAPSTSMTGAYRLDRARTRLGFVARHAMLTKVRGTFETVEGRAYLDFARPERSSVEVTVDAATVNTRNARRDEHLRSRSFFDVAEHERITFRSTAVRRLGDDRFRLTGELTVKDRTGPVVVDLVRTGTAENQATFEGRTTLDRRDWGLGWGGVLIADEVALELDVAAVRTDSAG